MKHLFVVVICFALVLNLYYANKKQKQQLMNYYRELEKRQLYYSVMVAWVDCLQHNISIGDYLKKKGIQTIGIYGMQAIGERVFCDLMQNGINPVCIIDKSDDIYGEIPIYRPEEQLPELDMIIVTAEYYYAEIKETLLVNDNCEIVALSTIISNASHKAIV